MTAPHDTPPTPPTAAEIAEKRRILSLPLRPCAAGGCGELVRGESHCERHRKTTGRNAKRADKHYMTARWKRLRKLVLARSPYCAACKQALATDVDHITPRSAGGEDTLENLQGLCKSCHSAKTARESSGWTARG